MLSRKANRSLAFCPFWDTPVMTVAMEVFWVPLALKADRQQHHPLLWSYDIPSWIWQTSPNPSHYRVRRPVSRTSWEITCNVEAVSWFSGQSKRSTLLEPIHMSSALFPNIGTLTKPGVCFVSLQAESQQTNRIHKFTFETA